MRIPAAAVMAAVFLSAAISSFAQTAAPGKGGGAHAEIYGAGTRSCGSWLADRDTMHHMDLSWVLGFLSASDSFMVGLGRHMRETDANAVSAWLDKYCRDHPLRSLAEASDELMGELAKPE